VKLMGCSPSKKLARDAIGVQDAGRFFSVVDGPVAANPCLRKVCNVATNVKTVFSAPGGALLAKSRLHSVAPRRPGDQERE